MAEATKPGNGKVTTPLFRLSFPNLFEPKPRKGDASKLQYSITMLFPKGTDLSVLKNLAVKAITDKWGPRDKWPANLRVLDLKNFLTISGKDGWPFRDGDAQAYDGYAGMISVPARGDNRPVVVDKFVNPIIDKDEVYPGCWCHASVTAYAWDNSGNRGVSFGLLGVQKVKDDLPFTRRCDPQTEFKAYDDASEDPGAYSGDFM